MSFKSTDSVTSVDRNREGLSFARRFSVHSGRQRKADTPFPLSLYRAPGDLRQDPGRAAEWPAEVSTCRNESCLLSKDGSRREVERITDHAVVVAGGGPTGLMLAGELALAGVGVAVVERRASQDLIGSRAGGLHSRTIEILDQRGIADRFLSQGRVTQVAGFSQIPLDISDFPTRHPYGLALWQNHIERILAGWVGVPGFVLHQRPSPASVFVIWRSSPTNRA
jgi:hypothetical protein